MIITTLNILGYAAIKLRQHALERHAVLTSLALQNQTLGSSAIGSPSSFKTRSNVLQHLLTKSLMKLKYCAILGRLNKTTRLKTAFFTAVLSLLLDALAPLTVLSMSLI
jgi:hypothetical protein